MASEIDSGIKALLNSIHLSSYLEKFYKHNIRTVQDLRNLSSRDLLSIGIQSYDHRQSIMSKANNTSQTLNVHNHCSKDNQDDLLLASGMEDIQVITDDIAYRSEFKNNFRRESIKNMNRINEEEFFGVLDDDSTPCTPLGSVPGSPIIQSADSHRHTLTAPNKGSKDLHRSMSSITPRITISSQKSRNVLSDLIDSDEQVCYEVYCDESKVSNNVKFGKTMTARTVCQLAVLQLQQEDSIYWQLFEYYPDSKIEKPIEDHQVVYDICRTWPATTNSLLTLRLSERKFDIIKKPADCLGPFFTHNDGTRDTEKLRRVLLMDIFQNQSSLYDIPGSVYIKHGKKWKKSFAVMGKDGIYTWNKSDPKESAICYCLFTELNCFYGLNHKKHFGAPSNHCLVFTENYQTFDPKICKSLCTSDANKLFAWFCIFRIGKHGQQLIRNYTEIIQSNSNLAIKDCSSLRSRSHTASEVVRNRSLSFLRGLSKKKDPVLDSPSPVKNVSASPGPLLHPPEARPRSGTQRFTREKKGVPIKNLTYDKPWFHASISRIQAVEILTNKGTSDGLFLIRESISTPGSLVLSLCHKKKVHHIQIVLDLRENAGDHLAPMEFGKSGSRIIGSPKIVKIPIETEADRVNKIRSRASSCPNREALKERMAAKEKIAEKEVLIIYSLEDQYQFAELDQLIDHYQKTQGVLPTKLRKFVDGK